MRAVVLHETGGPDKLAHETVVDPKPGDGEVLVRVRASAVCGRDLVDRRGGFPMMKLPTILGHEMAGEVVELGPGGDATGLAVGDRVVNLHRPSCMSCARCLGGEPVLCERAWQSFGHTVDGAYAELVVAHHRALVKAPASLSFEVLSTLMCTAGVALFALRARGRLALGETALITGASGGVGAMAIGVAKNMGARVVATTTSPAKVDALRELGADHVVVSANGRFDDEVKRVTDGGADLALELTGSATFTGALRSVRRGGRVVVVGNIEAEKVALNPGYLILHGLTVTGSASCAHRDLADVFDLVSRGALKPRIDRVLPLSDAAEAHRLLGERAVVGRVVLVP
ncbi:MAG TPA: zinc-binding dehydrogenase [Byssovorax sp.]|jgi:NADPH:quinone reductase-like Zn-dependent oxidoreductase